MSIHLVIIDALNLIRRVHSAQPDPNDIARTITTTSRTLNKIISESQPSHMIAVFLITTCKSVAGERKYCLNTSKNRKPMPEPLMQGLEAIQDAWWQLGIDSLLSDGDEADDLVATLAMKVANHGEKKSPSFRQTRATVNCSPQHCKFVIIFQHRWLDEPFIEKEFGVKPTQLSDYWGLTGVSSSQVPGVPGVGPKSSKRDF
ncbi:flap endonuclease Xni [Vibrio sinaloensis]|nr:flap endonuclease Xni [Vibrio sinaloensis]